MILFFRTLIISFIFYSRQSSLVMFNKLNQYFIKLYNQYSDQDRLIQIKEGGTEAFEALYYRHFTTMYLTAYKRIRRDDVINKLVQDVFINLWLKRGTLDRIIHHQHF